MNKKQIVYLILAILGVIVPWYYNLQFLGAHDNAGFIEFFEAVFNSSAAGASLTIDITIVYVVFVIWCVIEGRKLSMKHIWFYIVWGMFIALASAFPLFLLMRERQLNKEK